MLKRITKTSLLLTMGFSHYASSEEVNYLIVEDKSTPFQITEAGISRGGIITDIIGEIFKDSRYTVKYHVLPLNRLYQMVESKQIKNWVAYDAKNWNSLSQWGEFVAEPLFSVNHTYLTCHESHNFKITTAKDISQKKIAVIQDFMHPELKHLEDNQQLSLVSVDNYAQGIHLAALNRVDGFVEMDIRLRFNLSGVAANTPCLQFVDISEIIPAYSIYLSTDKHSTTDLNTFVNDKIKELKKSKQIRKVINKYNKIKAQPITLYKPAM